MGKRVLWARIRAQRILRRVDRLRNRWSNGSKRILETDEPRVAVLQASRGRVLPPRDRALLGLLPHSWQVRLQPRRAARDLAASVPATIRCGRRANGTGVRNGESDSGACDFEPCRESE